MQKEDHTKHHSDADGGIHDAPSLPPIKIVVTKGEEDVSIKIADQGGGMPRSVTNVWYISFTISNNATEYTPVRYPRGLELRIFHSLSLSILYNHNNNNNTSSKLKTILYLNTTNKHSSLLKDNQ